MAELEGRTALVTGASRGIGAAIARRFAAEGARVAITARTLDSHDHLPGSLHETAAWIEARGGRVEPIVADLADPDQLERIVEEATAAFGPIDILVNNAAAALYGPFEAVSTKRFQIGMNVNVYAPWRLSQLVLPPMRQRREGWILNISSKSAVWPEGPPWKPFDATNILYGSSKAALERMTVGLAAACAADELQISAMAPLGAVPTEGAEATGVVPEEAWVDAESREAMAEASLALCSTRDPKLNGRITYCTPILEELGRSVRTIDGSRELEGPREDQARDHRLD
jgi:NAD(P)-dependent dehydrogenase (short-subunit alcohol dehydrogenase family)